jgi:dienelactone hydrolase
MNTEALFAPDRRSKAPIAFALLIAVLIGAVLLASAVQSGFGRVEVSNVAYLNSNGIRIRAKLMRPEPATRRMPLPGIVYIHGYQNNRETSDAYCIELARRGFVVLNIDAVGRGNSGIPGPLTNPDFDPSYGGKASLAYLRSLPFVDVERLGLMGHSLGAEIVYNIALQDSQVKALVISGFAYTDAATTDRPRNMLMIFGRYDEFRRRMTGTRDLEAEWMRAPASRRAFAAADPQPGQTYGNFADGSARRVFMPPITHLGTSHDRRAIAAALEWMQRALQPPESMWVAADRQIWPIKEFATLAAMAAGLASLLPLGLILLRTPFFDSVQGPVTGLYACVGECFRRAALRNGVLMLLYFPIILVLFGIHVYLVPIDRAFPLMMTNGIVWWFLWVNVIGFFFFRRWYKKEHLDSGLSLFELGLSYREDGFALDGARLGKTVLLAAVLFLFVYLTQHTLESLFIVDFRFIFPFASDLTAYRAGLWFTYFPFLLIGFVLLAIFLHGQLRRPLRPRWWQTFISWSAANIFVLIAPLVLMLLFQYLPLFAVGRVPLVGPGGMLIAFTHNLIHIVLVLVLVIPISTWFYQLTGKIYLGALLCAAIVAWMFVSSQVVAPIPV